MVANPYRSVEAAPVLEILAAVAVMSPADATTLSCDSVKEKAAGEVCGRGTEVFLCCLT